MPTNLKSLLNRSRSRNELKSRGEKEGEATGQLGSNGGKENGLGNGGCDESTSVDGRKPMNQDSHSRCCGPYDQQFLACDTPFRNASQSHLVHGTRNNNASCSSHLVSAEWPGQSQQSSARNDFSQNFSQQSGETPRPGVAMRKCETVITLSSFTGAYPAVHNHNHNCIADTSTSTSTCGSGTATTQLKGTGEKAKVMKNKILSTSSSTLNCLLHSSSRSKLFSTWKLSSGNGNSSTDYPEFATSSAKVRSGMDEHETPDVQQIFKSQLSVHDTGVGTVPVTPLNRLRRNVSINSAFYSVGTTPCSRSSSIASFGWRDGDDFPSEISCRLCLCSVKKEDTVEIGACSCRYCRECLMAYINFEIQEGAEEIACPDASCEKQGVLSLRELEILISPAMMEKHKKFRLYREVEKDGQLIWCPTPGCETICRIQESNLDSHVDGKPHKSRGSINKSLTINCTTCGNSFCVECKLSCHPGTSCEAFRRKLIKQGKLSVDDDEVFSLDSIKKCPFCHVPIEKDSGCAQMMCKKCKHVFCWYCLASLDDDFLLRHYDKGPCKNKLGHSRASVVWHRAQVIGIFAGFGVLVLLASPLLILAAPCLLCCRCRYCAKDSEDSPVHV